MKQLSLSQALILAILVALVPVGLLGVWQSLVTREYTVRLIRDRLVTTTRASAAEQQDPFLMAQRVLAVFARDPDVIAMGPACNRALARIMRVRPGPVVEFARWDASGILRCSTQPGVVPGSFRNDSFAHRAPGAVEARVMAPRGGGHDMLVLIAPVLAADGAPDGVITAALDPDWLRDAMGSERASAHAAAAIVDRAGRLVVASRPLDPVQFDVGQALGRAVEGSGGWLYSAAPLMPGQLYLVHAERRAAVFSASRDNLLVNLAVPILAILFALGALWIAIRLIVLRWLAELRALIERFSAGDFSYDPESFSRAPLELQRLGEGVQDMARAVETRDSELVRAARRNLTLAREVNHRVKNNLQIVMSLVAMQAASLKDSEARTALEQTRARIAAIGIIHKLLYDESRGRLGSVTIAGLAEGICTQLRAGFAGEQQQLECDAGPGELPLDLAVPTALFIVEVISDVFLHAVAAGGKARARVEIRTPGPRLHIVIRFNSAAIGPRQDGEIGQVLMNAYALQLRGEVQFEQDGEDSLVVLDAPLPGTD